MTSRKNTKVLIQENGISNSEPSCNTAQDDPNNIVPFKSPSISTSSVVPEFAITLKEAKKRIDMLRRFVDEILVPGIDYGIIPQINRPTLLKPGAEKLCDAFGFAKKVEVINRVEDWLQGIFGFEVKVMLINKATGNIEAEGIGSCNCREAAYKEQSGYDVSNTVLKIAKKRALIDATLTATRSSDIFTQDAEELEWLYNKGSRGSSNPIIHVTRKQLSFIFSLVQQKQLPVEYVKTLMYDRYSINESKQLTIQQASNFIDFLKSLNHQEEDKNK